LFKGLIVTGPDCAGLDSAGLDSVGPDCAGPDRTCTETEGKKESILRVEKNHALEYKEYKSEKNPSPWRPVQ
jgi:hypothetical protein